MKFADAGAATRGNPASKAVPVDWNCLCREGRRAYRAPVPESRPAWLPEPVIAEWARRGHEIQRWPDWIWTAGAVCAILADRRRGVLEAGADPRRAAYALGW